MTNQPLQPSASRPACPTFRARLALPFLLLSFGCRGGPRTVLAELDQARQLAASVRLQLNKANDASNRAVMADTDEASVLHAREAERATQELQRDATTLRALLESLALSAELRSFDDFQRSWTKYSSLDQTILALAVENTNLKAQRLSFGPAQQLADAFRDAVAKLAAAVAGKERCRADGLATKATLCLRETQVLLAPHIAEPSAARMTELEQAMTALQAQAGELLQTLAALGAAAEPAPLSQATSALAGFKQSCAEIVALSRRNTNVRSLQLALRDQPPLLSACDTSLQQLERALASEGSKATR